jgi:hypothetical protein
MNSVKFLTDFAGTYAEDLVSTAAFNIQFLRNEDYEGDDCSWVAHHFYKHKSFSSEHQLYSTLDSYV